jgi:hypothetical protein
LLSLLRVASSTTTSSLNGSQSSWNRCLSICGAWSSSIDLSLLWKNTTTIICKHGSPLNHHRSLLLSLQEKDKRRSIEGKGVFAWSAYCALDVSNFLFLFFFISSFFSRANTAFVFHSNQLQLIHLHVYPALKSLHHMNVGHRHCVPFSFVPVGPSGLEHIQKLRPWFSPFFLVCILLHGSSWLSHNGAAGLRKIVCHDSLFSIGSYTISSSSSGGRGCALGLVSEPI